MRKLRSTAGGASRPAFAACPTSAFDARRPRGVRSLDFDARRMRCCPYPSWTDAYPIRSFSFTNTTGFGGASTTVTGICCPASLKIWVIPSFLPMIPIMSSLDLDLDVHPGGQIELRQRIHRLRTRIENVDDALMRLELELLTRLLVHVRRPQHRPALRLRRQRDRPRHLRAGLLCRTHDVRRGLIDHGVVEGFETNSDSTGHKS